MRLVRARFALVVGGGALGAAGFGAAVLSTAHTASPPVEPTSPAVRAHVPGLAKDGAWIAPVPSPTPTPPAVPSGPSLEGMTVWAGGDSIAAYMAENFVADIHSLGAATNCVLVSASDTQADDTCYFWKISTGLARPDYFNWLAKLQAITASANPQAMVFMVGGNDAQPLLNPDGSVAAAPAFSDAWQAVYAQRVGEAMDIMTSGGRYAVWVGLPPMLDTNEYPGYNANMQQLNAIYRAQAAVHPRVAYVDAYALFAGADGQWSEYLPDIHNAVQQMRTPDGVHFTEVGGEFLAQHVILALEALLQQH